MRVVVGPDIAGGKALEKALRSLRKIMQREGVYMITKKKARYQKPSETRHLKKQSRRRVGYNARS